MGCNKKQLLNVTWVDDVMPKQQLKKSWVIV